MRHLSFVAGLLGAVSSMAQPLSFIELGSNPAFCRLFSYQNGGGVVFCAATGGTPDYTYLWENLQTGTTNTSTTWGGLNPGQYQITVTDDAADVLIDTVIVDSLNPIANFDVVSDDLSPIPGGWVGFFHAAVQFENLSLNFANPIDPFADTLFRWNYTSPWGAWHIKTNLDLTEVVDFWSSFTYDVVLVAVNKNGCTDTIHKSIGLFGPASTEESEIKDLFKLNAEVENELVKFENYFQEPVVVTIYNIAGEVIEKTSVESGEHVLPFQHEHGVYLYVANLSTNEKQVAKGKFVY